VRLFAHLMAVGDEEEKRISPSGSLSPLFEGGMGACVHSVTALASPMNGTTAYELYKDPSFDPDKVRVPLWSKALSLMMAHRLSSHPDGRDERDYAGFDMGLDRAKELNSHIVTLPGTYYFSVPMSATDPQKDGTHRPRRDMEPLFVRRSYQLGAYKGKTMGGMTVDESWRENDGLVNTRSARAPDGAAWTDLDKSRVAPGLWNVFPTVRGDHMWPQGGLMRRHNVRDFYLELLGLIEGLAR